jgi:DNA-binding FadR family transcriptional regulator
LYDNFGKLTWQPSRLVYRFDMPVRPATPAPRASRSLPVIEALEAQIRENRYRSGDCLPSEKEIGREFQVSRTVVREALQALKTRGILEGRRGSGTYVSEPGHGSIRESLAWYAELQKDAPRFLEMMDLRILVETFCARQLAAAGGPLDEVRRHLFEMERHTSDLTRFADADISFHLAIIKASGHSLFTEVAHAVLPALGRSFARRTHIDPAFARLVLREHRQIYRQIETGRAATAESSMRTHLQRSRQNLLKRLDEAASHQTPSGN